MSNRTTQKSETPAATGASGQHAGTNRPTKHSHQQPRAQVIDITRAVAAMNSIPADCDRDTWVRIGMAAKSAGLDFDDFDTWSASASNYGGQRETLDVWRSFRDGGGIGPGTLFAIARDHGWTEGERQGKPVQRSRQGEPSRPSKRSIVMPIPEVAPPPPTRHPVLGEPTQTWVYRDANGHTLLLVNRFNLADGSKEFRPLGFDGSAWVWRGPDAPRPLYGLERLAADSSAPVIVTEGEKAADAATALVPDAVSVSPMNGAQSPAKADWSALAGRRVIVWPDADEPGAAFAMKVVELARAAGAAAAGILDVHALAGRNDVPSGWDAADALSESMMARRWDDLLTCNENQGADETLALDEPLSSPASIYHPQQIVWKKHKDAGDYAFGGALGTAENLSRLVAAYGVRVRYNELSRDVEISIDGKLAEGDLARNARLSVIEDLCRINKYPYTSAAGHLDNLASRDSYNPALDWVRSRAWDGGSHIRALFDCLTLADGSTSATSWGLFRKWMLGAVAILSGHARKFEHVLVLVDPHGGIGKTRFFNSLCPREFQADGVTLNPDDKDSVLHVVSKWIVELGEIGATFTKSDIESLKAFLSRDNDELRPAYARAANCYQRRTAFFGSVNNVQFLVDDTNNRRFWPIQVAAVNYQHSVDVQQAWAEALWCVEAGETWHLDANDNLAIGDHNEAFRSKGRVEELILGLYDPGEVFSRYLSASQVLDEVGVKNPTQADTRKAASLLRKLFPHKVRRGLTVFHLPYPHGDRQPVSVARDRYCAEVF